MKLMSGILALLVALGSPAFFVLAALFGYRYAGAESSVVYVVFSLAVALLGVGMAVFDLVRRGRRYSPIAWMVTTIPLVIGALYLSQASEGFSPSAAWPVFRNFFVWSAPALYVGLHIGSSRSWPGIQRLVDPLMLFLSLGALSALVDFLIQGWAARGIGGATYQTLSYVSALAFGLNLYLLRDKAGHGRYRFVRLRAYRLSCAVLLPVQLFAAVVSGGRGGVVLIGVYLLLELITRRRSAGGRLQAATVVVVVVAMAVVLLQLSMPNSIVGAGYDRALAYISSDGIDWSGTSGRDAVYSRALNMLDERLLFGYGPFGFVEGMAPYVYPHNALLEILLAGGVVGFTGVMLVLAPVVRRYLALKRNDATYGSLGVLMTYQTVMLMFSGTYLAAPTLWFAIGVTIGAMRLGLTTPGIPSAFDSAVHTRSSALERT